MTRIAIAAATASVFLVLGSAQAQVQAPLRSLDKGGTRINGWTIGVGYRF
jgi:hypothetical protein